MEMSPAYLQETAEHLAEKGYSLKAHQTEYGEANGTMFVLSRPNEQIDLEHVVHPDGSVYYYFALLFHGIKARSFPLDSWRHWPDRVEFKLRVHPDLGSGYAFTIDLPRPSSPSGGTLALESGEGTSSGL